MYSEILNSGDADAIYEHFWYNFKDSVVNISKLNNELFLNVLENIDKTSNELNFYKKQNKITNIIIEIENFLSQFLWTSLHLFENENCQYHLHIAHSNIKRWSALLNTGTRVPFRVLKLIYSIINLKKHTYADTLNLNLNLNLQSLVKQITSLKTFDREKILEIIVFHAYKLKSVAIFNKLTIYKEDQTTTIAILKNMNLKLPDHIKDGQKIVEHIILNINLQETVSDSKSLS